MKYEYLLIKRNGNKNALCHAKIFSNSSMEIRKDFKKDDILLKCKSGSVYHDGFCLTVKKADVIKKYVK